jgi:hypothetical protein
MKKMKSKNVVKTKINIDFINNLVDVFAYVVEKTMQKKVVALEDDMGIEIEKYEQISIIETVQSDDSQPIFTKQFRISDDFESVIVDKKIFKIPSFFNREMILEKDVKTWEMIFYYVFSEKINEKMQNKLSNSNLPIFNTKINEENDI